MSTVYLKIAFFIFTLICILDVFIVANKYKKLMYGQTTINSYRKIVFISIINLGIFGFLGFLLLIKNK